MPSSRCAGIKTLAVRMERHCGNAMHVAAWLAKHPKVERVIYPGLASHPQHTLAARQMNARYGGMVTAVLKGGLLAPRRFLERCRLFTLAESLGGVESLIEHPAIMTHASLPEDVRADSGSTRAWCACRSASRASTTSSPSSNTRSRRSYRRSWRIFSPSILGGQRPHRPGAWVHDQDARARTTGRLSPLEDGRDTRR